MHFKIHQWPPPRVHHRQGHRQQRGKHPFYSAPRSTEIICAAHWLSHPEIIGRHLRASNEMIHVTLES